jgi:hypothetical protein
MEAASSSGAKVVPLPGAFSLGFIIESSLAELLALFKGGEKSSDTVQGEGSKSRQSPEFDLIVLVAKSPSSVEKVIKNIAEKHLSRDGVIVVVSEPQTLAEESGGGLLRRVPPSTLVEELYPTDLMITVSSRRY